MSRVRRIVVVVVCLVAAGGRWFVFLVVVVGFWSVGCVRRVGRFSVCGVRSLCVFFLKEDVRRVMDASLVCGSACCTDWVRVSSSRG